MDIKEAIIHARQVAEGCGVDSRDCAYQHDCLAEWLEELVAYRAKISFNRLDETAALVKAQDEGRVFVSPIAIAQKIYKLSPLKSGTLEWTVIRIIKSKHEFDFEIISSSGITHRFSDKDMGKTVFLTRAEAEAALGGGGDGHP